MGTRLGSAIENILEAISGPLERRGEPVWKRSEGLDGQCMYLARITRRCIYGA